MKKFWILLTLMALLAFSCSKDSLTDDGSGQVLSGQKMLKTAGGAVITLSPSQDGDDTDELLTAFEDAKAAGPGSTVQLAEGEYHIGFILVEDFVGSFKGTGMGKTIIIPNLNLNNWELYGQNLLATLVKFLHGDVMISDMSFRNLEGEPSPGDDLGGFLGFHDWAATELPDLPADHNIKAVVDHVEFISHPDQVPTGWTPYAVQSAIFWGADIYWGESVPHSMVDITITNCTVSDMNWAFTNMGINKGRMVISNNGPLCTPWPILLADNIGGSYLITKNVFYIPASGRCGITINDYWFTPYGFFELIPSNGCQYEISENVFYVQGSFGAIEFANDRIGSSGIIDNKNPVQVLIKNNQFDLQGEDWAGIWNWITDNAVIKNNIFTGQAKTGIYVDPRSKYSLMLGNNFEELYCTGLPEIPGYLTIPEWGDYDILLLGSNNMVVSNGKDDTSVLNLGEKNIITGVKFTNEGEDPLGQTITDNYRIWKENMVKMRKK